MACQLENTRDFSLITKDYATVIAAINRRFKRSFTPYVNSPGNDQIVFGKIDSLNEDNEGGEIRQLARPSAEKSQVLSSVRHQVRAHPLAAAAQAVFEQLLRADSVVTTQDTGSRS